MDGTQRLYRGMYYVRVFNVINREIACTYSYTRPQRATPQPLSSKPARNRQLDSAADTLEHTDYSVCRAEAAQASGIKDFKNMRYCYSKHVTCVCTL